MEDNLLGYLLNALDERTHGQVETYLKQHPDARAKLAQLKRVLEPLAVDAETAPAPPLLVERTLARVAEHICAGNRHPDDLPQAPPIARGGVVGRSWWRRADVLVAACLLVTFLGVSLTILGRLRGPSSTATLLECKNNLRQFYVALQTYRDQHGEFPDVAKEEAPRDVAGMFVPMLSDAGTLPQSATIRCPGVGTPLPNQVTLAALRTMSPADFEQHAACLSLCYAYSLGYRDEAGAYHGPGHHPPGSWSQTPIMADRPPGEGVLGNSINHGGLGQNVLFADGHVSFLSSRTFGAEDDIFLNRDTPPRVAAGVDATDTVLGYSSARPK